MLEKLEAIAQRRQEVENLLGATDVMQDMKRFAQLNKEYRSLEKFVIIYHEYKNLMDNIDSSRMLLTTEKDADFRDMAKAELEELEEKRGPMEDKIRDMLIPEDPTDEKNAIFEIRAGTGGDEACIFVGDLLRMYLRYCDTAGLKAEVMDTNYGSAGGYSKVTFEVNGDHAYGILKYESGVHRVQRVPATETQGRIHTSAVSVVVLPQVDEIDVDVKESDIRKDTFCSSGPGGQSVNTTYSAIRLTHIPSGIVAQCQDEKSQIKNYEKALKVLRARIYEVEYQKWLDEISKKRKTMVSTGDRSAKIRTYNYPQGRVTDHRIGYTMYNLPSFVDGNINEVLDQLQVHENAEKLKEGVVA
ncbi:MAG: peptide chain release factor 1 [Bacteroidota bacterium]|nr:peptide chain release factor 1 [Bacteroidota bacterium]